MKTLLTIYIHSYIDLITNSSTEMFAFDSKEQFKFIENILNKFTTPDTYEKPWKFSKEEYRKSRKNDKEIKENDPYLDVYGYFYDKECEEDLKDARLNYLVYNYKAEYFREFRKKTCANYSNDKCAKIIRKEEQRIYNKIENLPDNEKPLWWNDEKILFPYEWPIEDIDNKIIVMSAGSNAISYDALKKIENTLNATRYHLG